MMHAACVPVFSRYLGQLSHIAALAEAHASHEGIDPQQLLQARLAADMLPFAAQVDIAAQFSLRACAPLAGLAVPAFGGFSLSFAALQERVGRSSAFLAGLSPAQMQGSEQVTHGASLDPCSRRRSAAAAGAPEMLVGFRFRPVAAPPRLVSFVQAAGAREAPRRIGLQFPAAGPSPSEGACVSGPKSSPRRCLSAER